MPDVAFKDLSIDANDPHAVGTWWADLLGLRLEDVGDGDYALEGSASIWIALVPEALGPSPVRLEVRVPGSGERSTEEGPEGLEWLRFPGSEPGAFGLLVSCEDPQALARWWAERTGATLREHGKHVWLEDVPGFPWEVWAFGQSDSSSRAKNRVHWDVTLVDGSLDGLVSAGATFVEAFPRWTVLQDPAGNEFCVFSSS